MKLKTLIIKSEIYLVQELQDFFKKQGWSVDVAYDGENGIEYAKAKIYDFILLDANLTCMRGLETLISLRKAKVIAPIFVLISKDTTDEVKSAMILHANDYIFKPYKPLDLLITIKKLLENKGTSFDVFTYGNIKMSLEKRAIKCGEKAVSLTDKEYKIFGFLLYHPEQIISKQRVIDKIWGIDSEADVNNIEVYISFLRKKLKHIDSNVEIRTIRGVGYALTMKR